MYETVLVPLDGSELAENVLPHVETIAGGCDLEVVLVRVVEPLHMYQGMETGIPLEDRQHLEREGANIARDYLAGIAGRLAEKGIRARYQVLFGKVADQLVDYANNNRVDLVIIASHGRSGLSRWVWGSVAERILRSVCTPVLMVRVPGCVIEGRKVAE